MMKGFCCQVCASDALELLDEYGVLPRVTSDAKPWPPGGKLSVCNSCGAIQKIPDDIWLKEIDRVYADYDMYHLSNGAEQLVFAAPDDIAPRSQKLVDFVMQRANLANSGNLLDIGCGNGEALARFSKALPGWQLNGNEITNKSLATLRKLPNFATLYTVPPAQIEQHFALISMIHSLEHMTVPAATLSDAAALLDPGGILFIEVPDIETSPFDLLVADHLMHFSRATLGYLVRRCGYIPDALVNDLVPKEITLLARCGATNGVKPDPRAGLSTVRKTLRWLSAVITSARALASKSEIGIFGTSVAGMALYGILRDRVGCFVDEDPARTGKSFDGRPVLAPADVPRGTPVLIALPPERAQRAAERLASTGMHAVGMPAFPAV
jgi:SAM-dependent methyltransferase